MNIFKIIDKFEYRHGNIFTQPDLMYIAHQCNCFHCMKAGIAGQIAKQYPQVAEYDKKYSKYGDLLKLGSIQIIDVVPHNNNYKLQGIINMYSQYYPGHYKTKKIYNNRLVAIKNCLNAIKNHFYNYKNDVLIGFPYLIGCGISGLNEEHVIDIFNDVFDSNITSNIKIIFIDFNKTFDIYQPSEFDWNNPRNDENINDNFNF